MYTPVYALTRTTYFVDMVSEEVLSSFQVAVIGLNLTRV